MFRKKIQKFSIQRRRVLVSRAIFNDLIMRFCKVCSFVCSFKECKMSADFDKCVECIRLDKRCDLTFFDFVKWRRLKKKRKRLRKKIQKSLFRQLRLQKQFNFLKREKKKMIESEFKIIFELKKKEQQKIVAFFIDELLFDVFFERFQIFSNFDWLSFSTETVAEASDSSWDFSLIFKCFRYVRNLFI